MKRIKFLVIEGPDDSGKTTLVKTLCESHSGFVELNMRWDETKRLVFDAEEKIPMVMSTFKHFDPDNVYVIDRFLMSDLIYDSILRGRDVTLYQKHLDKFRKDFDVMYVVLDRNDVNGDHEDSKIRIPHHKFQEIIEEYRIVDGSPNEVWHRQIVSASAINNVEMHKLLCDLIYLYFGDALFQEEHATDLWKFFLCCVSLNNTNGRTARKVMMQFFADFPQPNAVLASSVAKIANAIKPLGLSHQRALAFKSVTAAFHAKRHRNDRFLLSRDFIMGIPGLGKYAADSYEMFVSKNPKFVPEEPFDKELRKVYESR